MQGFLFDEETGAGLQAAVTSEPVALTGQSAAPMVLDAVSHAHIQTRPRTTTPDPVTGYWALLALATNDPDLEAYGGRRITLPGQVARTIEVPWDAPQQVVSAGMAAQINPGNVDGRPKAGDTVRVLWFHSAAGYVAPTPASAYYDAAATRSLIADSIAAASGGSGTADLPEVDRSTVASDPTTLLGKTTRFNTTSAAINQTLPAAQPGRQLAVGWDAGTNALTLTAAGSDVVGAGSATTVPFAVLGHLVTLHCTVAGRWRVTSGFTPQSGLDALYMRKPDEGGAAVGKVVAVAAVDGQGKVTGWNLITPAGGGGGGAVSSVAGRTGDVVIGWADLSGLLPTSKLPPLGITDVFPVTNQAARLALTAQRGDIAVQANPAPAKTYALATDDPTQDANWVLLPAIGSVQTVNGQQGAVVLAHTDVGASRVTVGGTYTPALDIDQSAVTAADVGALSLFPEAAPSAATAAVTPADMLGKMTRYAVTAAINQTLPPATPGATFAIGIDSGTADLTLTRAGSDVIGADSATSVTLKPVRGTRIYRCTTAGVWRVLTGWLELAALDARYAAAGSGGGSGSGPTDDRIATGESTFSRLQMVQVTSVPASSLCLSYFTATKTETITTLRTFPLIAAAGATLCRLGVYEEDPTTKDLTLVASIPNDTTMWGSTSGPSVRALSAVWAKVAGKRYAVGPLVVGASTFPAFLGPSLPNSVVVAGIMATAPRLLGQVTGQSDLPAAVTAASISSPSPRATYVEMIP